MTAIARLPRSREDHAHLSSMGMNEVAWTPTEAMWVDTFRQCWLHPRYPTHTEPVDTATMRIERRSTGYHVWMPPGAKWECVDQPAYAGSLHQQWISVAALHGDGVAR